MQFLKKKKKVLKKEPQKKKHKCLRSKLDEACAKFKEISEAYKYERGVLLLVDFSANPVKIYKNISELKQDGVVKQSFNENYCNLSPIGFSEDIVDSYEQRQKNKA